MFPNEKLITKLDSQNIKGTFHFFLQINEDYYVRDQNYVTENKFNQ